jgi:hypothetical protein
MKSIIRMVIGAVCGFLLVIPLNVLGMYARFRYNYLYHMSDRKLYIHMKYSNNLFLHIYYTVIMANMKSIAAALDDDYRNMLILLLKS